MNLHSGMAARQPCLRRLKDEAWPLWLAVDGIWKEHTIAEPTPATGLYHLTAAFTDDAVLELGA